MACARPVPEPNLVVDGERARSSVRVESTFFARSDCPVVEGCVGDAGVRRLLRFDLAIENRGDAPFVLGAPVGPLFQQASCHVHPHYLGFARFTLLRPDAGTALAVTKMGGCFRDDEQLDGGRAGLVFDCQNQGLSAGYADVYGRDLDCQWLDVTDVAAGSYALEAEVNFERRHAESSYEDDRVVFPVVLP